MNAFSPQPRGPPFVYPARALPVLAVSLLLFVYPRNVEVVAEVEQRVRGRIGGRSILYYNPRTSFTIFSCSFSFAIRFCSTWRSFCSERNESVMGGWRIVWWASGSQSHNPPRFKDLNFCAFLFELKRALRDLLLDSVRRHYTSFAKVIPGLQKVATPSVM